jgi:hypothetical protein
MLDVRETRRDVLVTNRTDALIWVALARVTERPLGSGRYDACELEADGGRRRGRFDGIKPGETVPFRLYSMCRSDFVEAPIEYRVGRNAGETAWWSDTALAAPGGHRRAY